MTTAGLSMRCTSKKVFADVTLNDRLKIRFSVSVLFLLAMAAPLASAQSAGANGGRQLEEVLVTATKREQSLRDIPASINALSGEVLEEQGAQELADFLKLTPGVTQNTLGSDQNRITIRGVGADTARLTTSQTTATMIGETSFSDPLFSAVTPDVNPFDLASVEILKGPQGTLFGSSGLSGAVRYVPQKPRFDEFEVKLLAGKSNTKEGEDTEFQSGAINVPAGSYPLALRLVRTLRDIGGIVDTVNLGGKDVDSRSQDSFRGMVSWQPLEQLTIDAMFMEQTTQLDETPFASDTNGRLIRETTFGPSTQTTEFDIKNLTFNWQLSFADLVVSGSEVTKFLDSDFDVTRLVNGADASNTDAVRIQLGQKVKGNSWEARLVSSAESSLRWLVGAFYLDYNQLFTTVLFNNSASDLPVELLDGSGITVGEQVVLTDILADVDAEEKALFVDVTWEFIERWELNIGLRQYKSVTDGFVTSGGAIIFAATQSPSNTNEARVEADGLNPKVALTWFATDDLSVYATVSKGFRLGGIQGIGDTTTTDVPETFKSDTLWNYEAGIRTSWFDRTLIADLTVYHVDWEDPQIVQRTPDNLFNIIDNVGSAEIDGAEFSTRYATPISGLSLNGVAAYTDARTAEPTQAPDGTPVPEGTPLPGTGKLQTSATVDYRRQIFGLELRSSLVYSFVDGAFNDLLKNAEVLGYETWDAHLTLGKHWDRRGFTLAVSATNLKDERGIGNILFNAEDRQDVYYIRPRTLEMRIALEF